MEVQGSRPRGIPRTRWMDNIRKDHGWARKKRMPWTGKCGGKRYGTDPATCGPDKVVEEEEDKGMPDIRA